MDDATRFQISAEVTEAIKEVENRISARESRRYRTIYLIVGFVSFIGIGVITQLVDFYANRAVDNKLTQATQELETAKVFSQLMALATKLDVSPSFTKNDRDTVIMLLTTASKNDKLRNEPAFAALLEMIVDSLSASHNPMQISTIFDMYEFECLHNEGIAITLVQHYGREFLAALDVVSAISVSDYASLQKMIDALKSHNAKGAAYAFQVLGEFKKDQDASKAPILSTLNSLKSLDGESYMQFLKIINEWQDVENMARQSTPELERVAEVVASFNERYAVELDELLDHQRNRMLM